MRIGQEVTGEAMTISVGRLQVHGYLQSYQKDLISKGKKVKISSDMFDLEATGHVESVTKDMSQASEQDAATEPTGYLMVVSADAPLPSRLAGHGAG